MLNLEIAISPFVLQFFIECLLGTRYGEYTGGWIKPVAALEELMVLVLEAGR